MSTDQLSEHALAELRDIAISPVPRSAVNPGCAAKLLRLGLVESVQMPTPFKTKWGMCEHLRITRAGQVRCK